MTYAETRQRGNATVDRRSLEMAIKFSKMNKAEVARKAGISQGTLSNLLHTRRTCTVDTAVAIAEALEVKPSDIFFLNLYGVRNTASAAA